MTETKSPGINGLPELDILLRDGADERNRTSDLLITNQLLYRLSYIGIMESGIVSKNGKKVFLKLP